MDMTGIPFGTTDWSAVEPTEHQGESGMAAWRTRQFGAIRVRWSVHAGYLADHWCSRDPSCLEGVHTELQDGRQFV